MGKDVQKELINKLSETEVMMKVAEKAHQVVQNAKGAISNQTKSNIHKHSHDPSSSSSSTSADETERITARLHMENAILRQSCHAWRARANAHVAAHVGLTTLARLAQDQARILRDERDELARKYDALKRKLSEADRDLKCAPAELEEEPQGHTSRDWPEYHPREFNGAETPADTDVTDFENHLCPPEDVSSESGSEPQRSSKRRKISHTPPCIEQLTKSSTSTPAMVIPHLVSFPPTDFAN